jgi:hypothetical protein
MKAIASTRDAIITKFHGSTATRGSRVSATISVGRVYHDYDHSMDLYSNHVAALEALCNGHTVAVSRRAEMTRPPGKRSSHEKDRRAPLAGLPLCRLGSRHARPPAV